MRISFLERPQVHVTTAARGAVIAASAWAALVAISAALNLAAPGAVATCPFRWATGTPCPACGCTRAALALGSGEFGRAIALNPLFVVSTAAVGTWVVSRLRARRRVSVELSSRERWIAWVVFAGAIGANWAWVIAHA